MNIIEFDYKNTPLISEPIILCLGYFDGIHLGHQKIINSALNEGYKVAVLTFDNAPITLINPLKEKEFITSNYDKAEYLEKLGVSYLLLMTFDQEAMELTKDQYIEEVLFKLNPVAIYCGEDYHFGYKGLGTSEYLKNFFNTKIFELEKFDNVKVASRDIITLIRDGNMKKVNCLLNRPYRINGLVVEGNHKGREIDFPTANLKLSYPYVFPKEGVYMGYAEVYDVKYRCIIEVGKHPTIMMLEKPIIEVHIIDFDKNIYGIDIFVKFIDFIREEQTFESFDKLKIQLQKDKKFAIKNLPLE